MTHNKLIVVIIGLILWLSWLTWSTRRNTVIYWRDIAYEIEDSLNVAQSRALRYARELRAIERKKRIVAICDYLPEKPDTVDMVEGE